MSKEIFVLLLVCLMPAVGLSDENKEVSEEEKVVSGMSIVGNDEAPKSLVIVPWKSSDLGGALDVSRRMDDGRGAVDREVFLRALDYYEIRTGTAE